MLVLSDKMQKRIAEELASIPNRMGKHVVTIEFSSGMGGQLNAVKIKKYSEEDIRND